MSKYIPSFSRQADKNEERKHLNDTRLDIPSRPDWVRSDVAVEEEIWNRILEDRNLGSRYRGNIAIDVEQGQVKLRGHVVKQWHISQIVQIASRAKGAKLVKHELIADNALQEQVIRALLLDGWTSPYIFTVKSHFGWIQLDGLVPTQEIAKAVEGIVGFVPSVRGILSLPSVFGTSWILADQVEPVRRALQPRLASTVYQDDDEKKPASIGLVSQVIIDPCSRLVCAIGVRVLHAAERLVPVTAVEAVNERGVWLRDGQAIEQFPTGEQYKFSIPSPNWRPPFPYLPGMVRWSI